MTKNTLILGAALILTAVPMANAQTTSDADQAIDSCLMVEYKSGVPQELFYQGCLKAFSVAIAEAQKTDAYSDQRRRIYWAQAGQVAGVALLLKVNIDKEMNVTTCNIALQGMKAYSQVKPPAAPGSRLAASDTLKNFSSNCHAQGFYNK